MQVHTVDFLLCTLKNMLRSTLFKINNTEFLFHVRIKRLLIYLSFSETLAATVWKIVFSKQIRTTVNYN